MKLAADFERHRTAALRALHGASLCHRRLSSSELWCESSAFSMCSDDNSWQLFIRSSGHSTRHVEELSDSKMLGANSNRCNARCPKKAPPVTDGARYNASMETEPNNVNNGAAFASAPADVLLFPTMADALAYRKRMACLLYTSDAADD